MNRKAVNASLVAPVSNKVGVFSRLDPATSGLVPLCGWGSLVSMLPPALAVIVSDLLLPVVVAAVASSNPEAETRQLVEMCWGKIEAISAAGITLKKQY